MIGFLRQARPEDLETINQLAYESEAYWSHDEALLKQFASLYKLTAATLKENITYVMTGDCGGENIVAFFCIKPEGHTANLEHFYVRRDLIGQGLGRKLWRQLIGLCWEKGFDKLEGVTFPKTLPFYLKMGASQKGSVKSKLNTGQLIPKFRFNIKNEPR